MKIEQRDLDYFAVVAEHGNIGRAGEALGMSQPALSTSLRRIERVIGTKIVRRTPKGVDLTDAGAALLKHVRRLRLAHEDILREVADIGQARSGHIRIGTNVGISDIRLAAACGRLFNEAGRVTITIAGGTQIQLLPALRAGEFDFLLTSAASPHDNDLQQEPVIEDEFVVYCSNHHRLARLRRATVADVAAERWVLAGEISRARLASAFEIRDLPPPNVALTAPLPELRLRIVAATRLLGYGSRGFVSEASHRLSLKELRIEGLDPVRRMSAVIYRKDTYLSPVARRLIEILKATAKEIAKDS